MEIEEVKEKLDELNKVMLSVDEKYNVKIKILLEALRRELAVQISSGMNKVLSDAFSSVFEKYLDTNFSVEEIRSEYNNVKQRMPRTNKEAVMKNIISIFKNYGEITSMKLCKELQEPKPAMQTIYMWLNEVIASGVLVKREVAQFSPEWKQIYITSDGGERQSAARLKKFVFYRLNNARVVSGEAK